MTATPAGVERTGSSGLAMRRFLLLATGLTLVALALRVTYFLGADVVNPFAGDIGSYVAYAWNLVHHHTFSSAAPGSATWPADAFRGPGYPAFLAVWFWLGGSGGGYLLAVGAQILVSTLTVPLAIAWARQWLSPAWSLVVGAGVAVWPHSVVFASTLLGETLFAATLLLMLLFAGRARTATGRGAALAAGAAGGAATLVNPVAMLFPPLLAAGLWRARRREAAVLLLAVHVAMVGAWSLRNAAHPGMAGSWDRAAMNMVQGSWPLYHAAYHAQSREPGARQVMEEMGAEERLLAEHPRAGLAVMRERMDDHVGTYAHWYLLRKPYLLWDWWVAIGWGDVHFLAVRASPYENNALFKAMHAVCRRAIPVLFGLALLAVVLALRRGRDDEAAGRFAWRAAAGLFAYVTVVHVVLQAEPRYSVAYRPLELALAVTAAAGLWGRARAVMAPKHPSIAPVEAPVRVP
jgi:hypothetical protein